MHVHHGYLPHNNDMTKRELAFKFSELEQCNQSKRIAIDEYTMLTSHHSLNPNTAKFDPKKRRDGLSEFRSQLNKRRNGEMTKVLAVDVFQINRDTTT